MDFTTRVERARLVDPAGQVSEQLIEQRLDPLTGAVASLNAAFAEKAKAFLGSPDVALLKDLQERSRATCPFCAAVEKGTRFTPELVPEGQLRVGRALAVPNLFAKAAFDAVVIVDPSRHVLFPSALEEAALADATRASVELLRRARARDAALAHHVAGMNFLAPGGSSVPHAHFQVHARSVPYSGLARLLERSDAWAARHGQSYWEALLEEERRRGERVVGETGPVRWLVPFAPSHQREVWGILPGRSSLPELSDAEAVAFAAGIARVIRSYEEGGAHAFTLAFHSSPMPRASFALQVRICARPAFRAVYANYDTWFAPKFMGDDAYVIAPEDVAATLRARW
jgi:UDPglucose--hexose-1-phosphate uridylyltransferase